MKKKLSPPAKLPTPAPCPENQPAGDMPAELKRLEGKTPKEVALAVIPELKAEAASALFFGLGLDIGIPVPEWAKKASRQFWKYYFPSAIDPFNSIEDEGVFFGLFEAIHKEIASCPLEEPTPGFLLFDKVFGQFALELFEKDARGKSPDETAKFYVGRARGAKILEKIKNAEYLKMLKRAPIYLCVALLWQQFELFGSKAEAERWLRAQKVIGESVNSREVFAVLAGIGLTYRGPGRPKKIKPDISNSTNQDSGT